MAERPEIGTPGWEEYHRQAMLDSIAAAMPGIKSITFADPDGENAVTYDLPSEGNDQDVD